MRGTGLGAVIEMDTTNANGFVTVNELEPFNTLYKVTFELPENYGGFLLPN